MNKTNPTPKQKRLQRIAFLLAVIMTAEAVFPMQAFALTGGPSQPEVESFEPVTTTEMVNLFSGDFNYNIPLMTVPGPNGGYPINLAYHAGIGMEQEASWVGLGWNINPGVINRNMRGLPDDFNGDEITKTLTYKPQETWSFDYSPFLINPGNIVYQSVTSTDYFHMDDENTRYNQEVFGFDTKKAIFSYHIHYDNYKGAGVGISMNITSSNSKKSSPRFSPSLSLSFDTDGGIGVTPSISYNKYLDDQQKSHSIGLGFNSRQGLQSLRYSSSTSKVKSISSPENKQYNYIASENQMNYLVEKSTTNLFQSTQGSGFSFAFNATLSNFQQRVSTISYQTGFTYGQLDDSSIKHAKYKKRRFSLGFTSVSSDELGTKYKAFGYQNYHDYSSDRNYSITDLFREGSSPATKNTPSISVGVASYDSYLISGQGIAGSFRTFRSNAIVLSDPKVTNTSVTAAIQPEWGDNLPQKASLPPPSNIALEAGGDYGVGYSRSYSGDWHSPFDNGLNEITTLSNIVLPSYNSPLYQSYSYKSTGEMSASPVTELDYIRGTRPMRFGLDQIFTAGEGIVSKVVDKLQENDNDQTPVALSGNNIRTSRQKQVQLLSTRTAGQLTKTTGYGRATVGVYNAVNGGNPNNFPTTSGNPGNYAYSNLPGHHTAEVTVTNPDGNRYVYGLPVYNKSQKEVMFSKSGIAENNFDKTADYNVGVDNSSSNNQGFENLYMSTEIPQYAYSYMLTAIYSPDYVDLTGDGPTDDDFGYWVKFNYTKVHDNYGWRIPYKDANYNKGQISNEEDDKLSYTYGTKEVYYLNSVQTKTHEARFILNTNQSNEIRTDANGAASENFMTSTPVGSANQLHYLKAIELVSKKDPNRIIKKAVFEYDYSLCKGILNTSDANNGKLTLKKLYFMHQGNNKGALSPYQFTYGYNPNYNQDYMDRWGYYQPDQTSSSLDIYSKENPYNNQADNSTAIAANNLNASAWNLSSIQLPSGGNINIEYEADTYGHVQDKRVMQMQQIAGLGEYTQVNPDGSAAYNAVNNKLNDRNTIVFFKLDRPISSSLGAAAIKDSIKQYVEDVDELFFKAFMKLKKQRQGANTGQYAYDYVQGYAKVDKSQPNNWYGFGTNNQNTNSITEGWVRIQNEERNPWNPIGQTDHPFKLAGWQYMRLERNDLFDNGNLFTPNSSIQNIISSFILMAQDFPRLFGYYRFCQMSGFCNELYLNSQAGEPVGAQPSYIRLNSPNKYKVGGGHRVKRITIADNWQQISGDVKAETSSYSVEYSYTNADGSTSGVAEYEPIIGGEEIPQHKPLRYNQRKYNYKDDGLYTEEPFGESLYPAPSVGYARVVVKNGDYQNVTTNRSGVAVTEFYTAKDFPIFSTHTDLKKKGFAIPVIVPMFMEVGYNNKGYSQGFSVELNNMHGQLKSKAVYAANADYNSPLTQPVSKEEYIYKTETPYAPDRENRLYNQVTVLDADGVYREANIGLTHDFTIDRQQHSNYSVGAGIETNMGAVPPYTFWGNVFPKVEISASMYRSISTLKVIQRNGILEEVRSFKDGAYAVSRNLMYDAETGQPLLTQTINNFDKPVYSYNYAAHWAYPAMGGAYKNAGATFYNATINAGVYSIANPSNYFTTGDEVEVSSLLSSSLYMVWVSAVDDANGTVTFIDEDNNPVTTNGTLKIIRSGYRNQQSVTNGTIVSLSNPVTERRMPLFDAFNALNTSNPPAGTPDLNGVQGVFNDFYTDCVTGEAMDVKITWQAPNTLQFVNLSKGECVANVVFLPGHGITNLLTAFAYDLKLSGGTTVYATRPNTLVKGFWSNPDPLCFGTCMDNVLHADASSFSENWLFNYAEAGNPLYRTTSQTSAAPFATVTTPLNPWRFGLKGIWRGEQSWAYQVDRKQSTDPASITNIAIDGTYKHFVPFNWSGNKNTLPGMNPQWTLGATITRYSPYGFELENVDPIGIYSSALYGYDQSLATAVVSNAQYMEMGFDGFEDYPAPAVYGGTVHGYGRGHLEFRSVNPSMPVALTTDHAHTGKYSLRVSSNGPATMGFDIGTASGDATYFTALPNKQYHLSLWVKTSSTSATPSVVLQDLAGNPIVSASPDPKQSAIEGWKRIELTFTTPATGTLVIKLQCASPTGAAAWFDDIRIQPFVSGMKTYVYDPNTLWLLAELDDRNYATFYNYDEEGALVQVKKETENGIVTLRSSRGNIKR